MVYLHRLAREERAARLESGDLAWLRAYLDALDFECSDEMLPLALHLARIGCRELPLALRQESLEWLCDNRKHHFRLIHSKGGQPDVE